MERFGEKDVRHQLYYQRNDETGQRQCQQASINRLSLPGLDFSASIVACQKHSPKSTATWYSKRHEYRAFIQRKRECFWRASTNVNAVIYVLHQRTLNQHPPLAEENGHSVFHVRSIVSYYCVYCFSQPKLTECAVKESWTLAIRVPVCDHSNTSNSAHHL